MHEKAGKCGENESHKTHMMGKGLSGGHSGFSVGIQREGEKRRPDPKKCGQREWGRLIRHVAREEVPEGEVKGQETTNPQVAAGG